jgi:hypothetical protein
MCLAALQQSPQFLAKHVVRVHKHLSSYPIDDVDHNRLHTLCKLSTGAIRFQPSLP